MVISPVLASDECYAEFSLETNYLYLGRTYTASFTKYPEDLEVTWYSSNYSVVTVSQTGVITPKYPGAANIYIRYYDDYDEVEVEKYLTVLVVDSRGIESGNSYYIVNANTGRNMASSSTNSSDYANVVTLNSVWSSRSQWEVVELGDGKFNIFGYGGSSGVILKTFGTSVELETQENVNAEKFSIYRIESGTYSGLYYIRWGNYYVSQDLNNNVYLSSVMNVCSRWSFVNVDKRDADFFGFQFGSYNTYDLSDEFVSTMDSAGFSSYSYNNSSAQRAYEVMRSYDDVFVYRGHAVPGVLQFMNASGTNTSNIVARGPANNEFAIYDLDNNELNRLRCVLYLGCQTGVSTLTSSSTYNLVDITFTKGAHFVLGTTEDVVSDHSSEFLQGFLESVYLAKSINECINEGITKVGRQLSDYPETNGWYPIYHIGDTWQILNNG